MSDTQFEFLLGRLTKRERKLVQKRVNATGRTDLIAAWEMMEAGKSSAMRSKMGNRANGLRHSIRSLVMEVLLEEEDAGGIGAAVNQLRIAQILLQREALSLGERALRKAIKLAEKHQLHECLLLAQRLSWQFKTARLQRNSGDARQADMDDFLEKRLQPLRHLEEIARQEWVNSSVFRQLCQGDHSALPEEMLDLLDTQIDDNPRAQERQVHARMLYAHLNGEKPRPEQFFSRLMQLVESHPAVFAERPDLLPLLRRSWLLEQVKSKSPAQFVKQVEALGLLEAAPKAGRSLRLRHLNYLALANYLEAVLFLKDGERLCRDLSMLQRMVEKETHNLLPYFRLTFFVLLTILLRKDFPRFQQTLRRLKPAFEATDFNPEMQMGFKMLQVLAYLESEELQLANSIARSLHYQIKKRESAHESLELSLLASLVYYSKEGLFVSVHEFVQEKFPELIPCFADDASLICIAMKYFVSYRTQAVTFK